MPLFGRETPRDQERIESYRQWCVRQHPYSLVSVVLGVFSLTHFGTLWVDGIAGVVFGVLAIRSVRKSPGPGVRLAYVGIIAGVVSLGLATVLYGMSFR